MTVSMWAYTRGEIIKLTEDGWDKHSCRRVWLVTRVADEDIDDHFYGNLVFATPEGKPDWLDLEDTVLTFDDVREARMVAELRGPRWGPLNLYDLMRWEDHWTSPPIARYRSSAKVLDEMARAWQLKSEHERKKR